jgi:hypothetical protein
MFLLLLLCVLGTCRPTFGDIIAQLDAMQPEL